MSFKSRFIPMAAAVLAIPAALWSLQPGGVEREALDPAGVQRLVADTGGAARVAIHPATGAARFVRLSPGAEGGLAPKRAKAPSSLEEASEAFFFEYGSIFGIQNPRAELVLNKVATDGQGMSSLTYRQFYRGVPVFAGELKTHFDARKQLSAVNGTFVPMDEINTSPSRSWQEASQVALRTVEKALGVTEPLGVRGTALMIFRTGLVRGVPGENRLVWEVEVGNGADVREFVYVDAHSGKIIDQITGVFDALNRRAYDAQGATAPGPNYPGSPFWVEGQALPTGTLEADNMIFASGETYGMFANAFSRDSFDAAGGIMDSIFNRGNGCPNASWNGTFISFCPGTTSDDVTAHEWGHAYTQYTHNLIYQWQPGALNESYSDIWGETVDFINGRQTDSPGGIRTAASCSAFTTLPPILAINSPAVIAGNYPAGAAQFGPALTPAGLTGDVVLVNDGSGSATPPTGASGDSVMDACQTPFANAAAIVGKIAMVYRGTCGFTVKVKNAQLNGAIGVIVSNHSIGGNALITMAGSDTTITIPSLFIGNGNGELIRAQLGGGVNGTLRRGGGQPIDNSYRWLIGEDATAFGGAIRDMWNPNCYNNPGKVSDSQYTCSTGDQGGVHSNSGVPNHGYALIVDGGIYNGQTITGLGLTKAAHIYFRAMTVYQTETTDFSDHADAIEQSCLDLIGANLADLLTGAPSGQVISASDCGSVESAALAVELRTAPAQCNFQPLLAQTPPADPACGASTARVNLFVDGFEGSTSGWTISHDAVGAGYDQPDWVVSSTLPDGRAGKAFFGDDPSIGGCSATDDESGVRHLTSPAIALPKGSSGHTLTFEHWVSTEATFDGGQLMLSVNGGAFTLVPQASFIYNGYNSTLAPATQSSNPRAGQPAWSGTDGGSVGGTWGRSIVNLAGLAAAGQTIQLRWDISTDGCGGALGWYVDDVTVYACLPTANPTISINDISVTEGNSGRTNATFTVSLSHASTKTITVKHKTVNGTAKSELDYIKNLEKTLTFSPLSDSRSITVEVLGETLAEPNETFFVNLSQPTNATIADSQGQCTITNDD